MKPNDNFRNSGPSKVSVEPPNTDSQLVKEKRQSEKLQKERDQAQQALKSAKDENDKLQKTIKDFEERFKRLEAQLHEKAPAPPSIPQASAIPQNQTNTSYQPHQISQAARMNPTYSTHGAERALNHGQTYPTQMTATAAGKTFLYLSVIIIAHIHLQGMLAGVKCTTMRTNRWYRDGPMRLSWATNHQQTTISGIQPICHLSYGSYANTEVRSLWS
jgi:hypothetical protein